MKWEWRSINIEEIKKKTSENMYEHVKYLARMRPLTKKIVLNEFEESFRIYLNNDSMPEIVDPYFLEDDTVKMTETYNLFVGEKLISKWPAKEGG
jgi:hypothetical protein